MEEGKYGATDGADEDEWWGTGEVMAAGRMVTPTGDPSDRAVMRCR